MNDCGRFHCRYSTTGYRCVQACFTCPPETGMLPCHGNARLAGGQLEILRPRAEVMAAADVVGWQRAAAGQYPWQSGRAGKQRGYFRQNVSGDPKSCTGSGHSIPRPPGNQQAEPDHPGFPGIVYRHQEKGLCFACPQ